MKIEKRSGEGLELWRPIRRKINYLRSKDCQLYLRCFQHFSLLTRWFVRYAVPALLDSANGAFPGYVLGVFMDKLVRAGDV